jgi:hypothetical protein
VMPAKNCARDAEDSCRYFSNRRSSSARLPRRSAQAVKRPGQGHRTRGPRRLRPVPARAHDDAPAPCRSFARTDERSPTRQRTGLRRADRPGPGTKCAPDPARLCWAR